MLAHLNRDGRMVPPKNYTEGLARRGMLETEIAKIEAQLRDTRRQANLKLTVAAYTAWRRDAARALQLFRRELDQLLPWLAAQPEANDFRSAHRLLHRIAEDDGLIGDEQPFVDGLDERYPEHLQVREGEST